MNKKSLAVLICAVTVITTSCLKKQDLHNEDLGPAIASIEVTKALGTAFGSYDYNEIKPKEFTSLLLTQKIQDSVTQSIEQQGITVENSVNAVDKLELDLIVQDELYSNGQTSQSTRKWPIVINKSSDSTAQEVGRMSLDRTAHTLSDAQSPMLTFLMFEVLAFGSCFNEGKYPETCHQLKTTNIQYKVPLAAANQHNCPDILNCYIPAKQVEFDIVRKYQLDQDGNPKRTHYTVVLSPQVPFLSRVLQLCSRSVYEISNSNQRILADICYSVNNYAAGTNTPAAAAATTATQ